MPENDQIEERGAGTGARKPEIMALPLDTLEHAREDLAGMTRAYLRGEVTDNRYRCFVYGTGAITKLLVHCKAVELEKRIEKLESRLGKKP